MSDTSSAKAPPKKQVAEFLTFVREKELKWTIENAATAIKVSLQTLEDIESTKTEPAFLPSKELLRTIASVYGLSEEEISVLNELLEEDYKLQNKRFAPTNSTSSPSSQKKNLFGKWLEEQISNERLSRRGLAETIGSEPGEILNWEQGKSHPTELQLLELILRFKADIIKVQEMITADGAVIKPIPKVKTEKKTVRTQHKGQVIPFQQPLIENPNEEIQQEKLKPFSKWLKEQISEKGWTQKVAAEKLCISMSGLILWLNGTSLPSEGKKKEGRFKRIADVFGVSVNLIEKMISADNKVLKKTQPEKKKQENPGTAKKRPVPKTAVRKKAPETKPTPASSLPSNHPFPVEEESDPLTEGLHLTPEDRALELADLNAGSEETKEEQQEEQNRITTEKILPPQQWVVQAYFSKTDSLSEKDLFSLSEAINLAGLINGLYSHCSNLSVLFLITNLGIRSLEGYVLEALTSKTSYPPGQRETLFEMIKAARVHFNVLCLLIRHTPEIAQTEPEKFLEAAKEACRFYQLANAVAKFESLKTRLLFELITSLALSKPDGFDSCFNSFFKKIGSVLEM